MRHLLLVLYVLVCFCAITWPVYDWLGNRVEPTVLGLPFVFAWNILWVLATFGVLVAYHTSASREPRH